MSNDAAIVRCIPMLKEVNALPRTKLQPPVHNRNRQIHGEQGRLYMSGHIVRPLVGMGQIGHLGVGRRRHETVKKGPQIGLDFGIGILLNEERARRMLHKKGKQPVANHPISNLARELVKALARRRYGKCCLHSDLLHPVDEAQSKVRAKHTSKKGAPKGAHIY